MCVRRYLESVRRYNYTTPKSYLELISLYKSLLAQKRAELRGEKERLESGVDKISQASAQVRARRALRHGGRSMGKALGAVADGAVTSGPGGGLASDAEPGADRGGGKEGSHAAAD